MAPRSKKRRTGLSRVDAALDAMAVLGFSRVLVRKVVSQLLKEYGGDEAWPFIEEYSYKELLEAILREQESNQALITEVGSSSQDGTLACTYGVASEENDLTAAEPTCDVAYPICSEVDNNLIEGSGDEEAPTKACGHGDNVSVPESALTISTSTPTTTTKLPMKPCYGWIESDEEYADEDFLCLEPAIK